MIFGVTGKSGSGKTTFCERACNKYAINPESPVHLNVDDFCHLALAANKCEVCNILGLPTDVSRQELGEAVFTNRDKYGKVVAIIWPVVEDLLNAAIDNAIFHRRNVYLDYILLPHAKALWDRCDVKILLVADDEERKERAMARDAITEEAFALRDSKSIEYDLDVFDYVIYTGKKARKTQGE